MIGAPLVAWWEAVVWKVLVAFVIDSPPINGLRRNGKHQEYPFILVEMCRGNGFMCASESGS